jgi:hypothetical protein
VVFALREPERQKVPSKGNEGSSAEHGGIETLPLSPMLCTILRDIQSRVERAKIW